MKIENAIEKKSGLHTVEPTVMHLFALLSFYGFWELGVYASQYFFVN